MATKAKTPATAAICTRAATAATRTAKWSQPALSSNRNRNRNHSLTRSLPIPARSYRAKASLKKTVRKAAKKAVRRAAKKAATKATRSRAEMVQMFRRRKLQLRLMRRFKRFKVAKNWRARWKLPSLESRAWQARAVAVASAHRR